MPSSPGAGIRLHHIGKATMWILSSAVRGRQYGVHASEMTKVVIGTIRRPATADVGEVVHTEHRGAPSQEPILL